MKIRTIIAGAGAVAALVIPATAQAQQVAGRCQTVGDTCTITGFEKVQWIGTITTPSSGSLDMATVLGVSDSLPAGAAFISTWQPDNSYLGSDANLALGLGCANVIYELHSCDNNGWDNQYVGGPWSMTLTNPSGPLDSLGAGPLFDNTAQVGDPVEAWVGVTDPVLAPVGGTPWVSNDLAVFGFGLSTTLTAGGTLTIGGDYWIALTAPLPQPDVAGVSVSTDGTLAPAIASHKTRWSATFKFHTTAFRSGQTCSKTACTNDRIVVLNSQGLIVKHGPLLVDTHGTWTWNGHRDSGQAVKAGSFRIRVQASGYLKHVSTKTITVKVP